MSVGLRALLVLSMIWVVIGSTFAEQPVHSPDVLHLSDEVRSLLLEEMREIAAASESIATSLVSADWEAIEVTAEQVRASYVMAKNLTDAERRELRSALPDRFKRLDQEFHARAARLRDAAAARDPELVAFNYYRMLESCAGCHADYAGSRFPGFSTQSSDDHRH